MAENPEQTLFGLTATPDGVPLLMLAMPEAGWDYIKDGKTHHFDLTKAGANIRIVMFGCTDRDSAMEMLQGRLKEMGRTVVDGRDQDFGIDSVSQAEAARAAAQPVAAAEADDGRLFKKGHELLIGADTQETPGKVKIVTVEFHTHFIQTERFQDMRFKLMDGRHPYARLLAHALGGGRG